MSMDTITGVEEPEVLYCGDHLYGDVIKCRYINKLSKSYPCMQLLSFAISSILLHTITTHTKPPFYIK